MEAAQTILDMIKMARNILTRPKIELNLFIYLFLKTNLWCDIYWAQNWEMKEVDIS